MTQLKITQDAYDFTEFGMNGTELAVFSVLCSVFILIVIAETFWED